MQRSIKKKIDNYLYYQKTKMLSTMIKFIKLEMFYSNFITYIKSNLGKFLNFYLHLLTVFRLCLQPNF